MPEISATNRFMCRKVADVCCSECDGKGAFFWKEEAPCNSCEGTKGCAKCDGKGWSNDENGEYHICKACFGKRVCQKCNGTGEGGERRLKKRCKTCKGEGYFKKVVEHWKKLVAEEPCDTCDGTGKSKVIKQCSCQPNYDREDCNVCGGSGYFNPACKECNRGTMQIWEDYNVVVPDPRS